MPLSEHEERILAEIEAQLAADDPRFAARARRRRRLSWNRATRVRVAAILGVVGALCVLSLGFVDGTLAFVLPATGMALLFVAILLGITLLGTPAEREQASVPPDERT
ncbi:MAG: DUF3040 domain-containing protein [Nitriliruptoraceae bacterium]|nr:DUF3040 domain-containing protein [Nitriliruptoraceae bacterium]